MSYCKINLSLATSGPPKLYIFLYRKQILRQLEIQINKNNLTDLIAEIFPSSITDCCPLVIAF